MDQLSLRVKRYQQLKNVFTYLNHSKSPPLDFGDQEMVHRLGIYIVVGESWVNEIFKYYTNN